MGLNNYYWKFQRGRWVQTKEIFCEGGGGGEREGGMDIISSTTQYNNYI